MSNHENMSWHVKDGARILLPSNFVINSPFPTLYAARRKGMTGITISLISESVGRDCAEVLFRQPPRSVPALTVEILQQRSTHVPIPTRELIWQIHNVVTGDYTHAWKRVVYLAESQDVIADLMAQGEGLFRDSEEIWHTVMDSFAWNWNGTVPKRYDSDDSDKVGRNRRNGLGSTSSRCERPPILPSRLRYLQPAIDELLSLSHEDINVDLDTTFLHQLLLQRVAGLSLAKAERRLKADQKALRAWMNNDRKGRGAIEILLAFMYAFEFELPDSNA